MENTDQLQSTAYHEAGHALATVVQDLILIYSTIVPTKVFG